MAAEETKVNAESGAIRETANQVAEALDAQVLFYHRPIDATGFAELVEALQFLDDRIERRNVVLFIRTLGGSPKWAYQISRLLQEESDRFHLCVSSYCKSAGTLIALGANEIHMGPVAELGPLDVQLAQRDEIGKHRSGMVVRTALAGLSEEAWDIFEKVMLRMKEEFPETSFETASSIAVKIAVGVMGPVYGQINPESLGTDLRDLSIATAYGERLLRYGGNAKDGTVKKLVEDYPEHAFVIDMEEAKTLFNIVKSFSQHMLSLSLHLGRSGNYRAGQYRVERLDGADGSRPNGDSDDIKKAGRNRKSQKVAAVSRGSRKADSGKRGS